MGREMMDIALDSNLDITLGGNGEITMIESTQILQKKLLLLDKGDLKDNPTRCVGVFNYLDDEGVKNLARAVSVEFAKDGMTINKVAVNGSGTIDIDAYYQ